jgi:6-phosphogluconolactonase (cycloisomerase 2 family)
VLAAGAAVILAAGGALAAGGPVAASARPSAPRGFIVVANIEADSVTEYAKNASGNSSPIATIAGSHTGVSYPAGVAVDSPGHLFVTNFSANSVTEYKENASGDSSPIATIKGSRTGLDGPDGIAVAG